MTGPAVPAEELYKLPPYDRMRYTADREGNTPATPPFPDDPADPCCGCGNWYGPCIWPCYRQMGYDRYPKKT